MFIRNKYTKWYYQIISNAKKRDITEEYYEKHHIIPKSLGGIDDSINIISLTAREHYICHLLLVKMTTGKQRQKMLTAFIIMSGRGVYNSNSKIYQKLRLEYRQKNSEMRAGPGNGRYNDRRYGSNNPFYGKEHTAETKRRISEKKKGIPIILPEKTDEHKRNLSIAAKKRHSVMTDKEKQTMLVKSKKTWSEKPVIECPHCKVTGTHPGNMSRYHFDQCLSK